MAHLRGHLILYSIGWAGIFRRIEIYVTKIMNTTNSRALQSFLESEKVQNWKVDIFFPSNHNIHKSSCGLCFWASDPLINRFYKNLSIKGSETQKQRPSELLWMLRFDKKNISTDQMKVAWPRSHTRLLSFLSLLL